MDNDNRSEIERHLTSNGITDLLLLPNGKDLFVLGNYGTQPYVFEFKNVIDNK
jgi:hypothetical protein